MFSNFLLGKLQVDDDVCTILGRVPLDLVARHAVCEFGDVSPRRYRQNLISLAEGDEIRSEYQADPTNPDLGRIRITTASGWGSTNVVWIKPQPKKAKNGLPF